jgi:cytidine deaminase
MSTIGDRTRQRAVDNETVTDAELRQLAVDVTRASQAAGESREGWRRSYMGYVGCALITDRGNVYTGVVVNVQNGIGFCAEHAAVAEMIKHGESRIARIAGATAKGTPLPPCGRCRELIAQVDAGNLDTEVLLPDDAVATLRELLPHTWQPYWDA